MKKLESSKVIAGRSYEKREYKKKRSFFFPPQTYACIHRFLLAGLSHKMCLSYNSVTLKSSCRFHLNIIWQMKDGSEAVLSIYSILCTGEFSRRGRGFCSVYHIMGTHKRHADQSQVHFRVTQHILPITQHAIVAHAHCVSHRDCIGSLSDSVPPHASDPPHSPYFWHQTFRARRPQHNVNYSA